MTTLIPVAVSPLRQRLIDEMDIRRFGFETQRNYIRDVGRFATFLGRSPDTATAEDVRRFQIEQSDLSVPAPTMNAIVSALRFFFIQTLDRPDLARKLVRMRYERKLPVVLSQDEVAQLLAATTCLKHQAALSVAYGAGLRAAEVAALKVRDIDSERMLLRVERGKGGRYRNAMLPVGLLALLREWWRVGRREGVLHVDGWLFPGQHYLKPLSTRQIYRVVVEAGQAAGIGKRVGPHTLRHCFATHLLEDGIDVRIIQALLGHAKLETTAYFTQVATRVLRNVTSPFDRLATVAMEARTSIAADPKHLGARIGITAVLHTWGSAMTHHPHIHMIVPGGGLSPDGSRWVSSRPAFLLPVRVLGKLFRRLFLTRLMALHEAGRLAFYGSLAHLADRRAFLRHLAPVRKKRWVVYAKPPFAGPDTVLAYLSRYTHRVAISNSRLLRFDKAGVTFRYKDYRRAGADRQQVMTLTTDEFIRRFLLHVLPKGFHRIRHYGLLASATRKVVLNHVRQLLGVALPVTADVQAEQDDVRRPCPCCGGHMVVVETFERQRQPRAPPALAPPSGTQAS